MEPVRIFIAIKAFVRRCPEGTITCFSTYRYYGRIMNQVFVCCLCSGRSYGLNYMYSQQGHNRASIQTIRFIVMVYLVETLLLTSSISDRRNFFPQQFVLHSKIEVVAALVLREFPQVD